MAPLASQPNRTLGCVSLPDAGSGQEENTRRQVEAVAAHLAASPAPEEGGVASLMARRVVLDGAGAASFWLRSAARFHETSSKLFPLGLWAPTKFGRSWQGGLRGGLTAVQAKRWPGRCICRKLGRKLDREIISVLLGNPCAPSGRCCLCSPLQPQTLLSCPT